MTDVIKPRKRPRSDFLHIRTLVGMSEQDKADFSKRDLLRFFKVKLWDIDHICKYPDCPFPDKIIETFEEATVDHIIPRAKGGRTRWVNVQLMHAGCNLKKGVRILVWLPPWKFQQCITPVKSRSFIPSKYDLKRRAKNAGEVQL